MAKIFATLVEDNEVVLKTWSSAVAFNKSESWLDDKFILIASSDDFKGKGSFPLCPLYDYEEEYCTYDHEVDSHIRIIRSKNEIIAHNLLFEARNKHLKLSVHGEKINKLEGNNE